MKKDKLYFDIKKLIEQAKSFVVQSINTTLVFTNYHIGRMIVEDEQQGSERAKYAEKTLKNLSQRLTKEFGKGYTKRNLELMRKFYVIYSKAKSLVSQFEKTKPMISQSGNAKSLIRQSAIANSKQKLISDFGELFNLSWTHYILLMRIENEDERNFYEIEAANNN